jgi:hypothetical protein
MTAVAPDLWQEVYLLGIIPDGGSEIQFAGLIQDISDITPFEKDVSLIQLGNGGTIPKFEEFTMESVTMKIYPISAGVDGETTATGTDQLFNKQSTADSTQPILVDNTITRQKFGIIFLRASTLPATAGAVPTAGEYAKRTQVINAYMTVNKDDWSDKSESVEVTFKWTPFQKDATSNKRVESVDNAGQQLPAAITTATSF